MLLAIPISAVLHFATGDLHDLRLTHALARFALRRTEDADAYLGDLDEHYAELQPS